MARGESTFEFLDHSGATCHELMYCFLSNFAAMALGGYAGGYAVEIIMVSELFHNLKESLSYSLTTF